MSALACWLLRHAIHPRWVGDLLCQWCETCDCLWVPEPIDPPAPARSAPPRWDQAADFADWAPGELQEAFGR